MRKNYYEKTIIKAYNSANRKSEQKVIHLGVKSKFTKDESVVVMNFNEFQKLLKIKDKFDNKNTSKYDELFNEFQDKKNEINLMENNFKELQNKYNELQAESNNNKKLIDDLAIEKRDLLHEIELLKKDNEMLKNNMNNELNNFLNDKKLELQYLIKGYEDLIKDNIQLQNKILINKIQNISWWKRLNNNYTGIEVTSEDLEIHEKLQNLNHDKNLKLENSDIVLI